MRIVLEHKLSRRASGAALEYDNAFVRTDPAI